MFGPGEEFLGALSTTIFFFFFINGSSKESKPSEAHPRIFFLVSSSSSDDARQSYWIVLPMDSFVFFSSSKSPCGNFDYLTGFLHETMSSIWKLRRKSLTVIIVPGGRLERRKELVGRFESSLRWRDGSQRWWERTFDWIFRSFIFSTICLESGNAEFVFFEEIYSWIPKTIFDDALSLLQKLMADFRSSKRT